jgi:hypothetical protein
MGDVINLNRRRRRGLKKAGVAEVIRNPNPLPGESAKWGFTLTSEDGHQEGCDLYGKDGAKITKRQAAMMAIIAIAQQFDLPVSYDDELIHVIMDPKKSLN